MPVVVIILEPKDESSLIIPGTLLRFFMSEPKESSGKNASRFELDTKADKAQIA